MICKDARFRRPTGAVLAAVYAAALALVIGYGCSYLLTHLGAGLIAPDLPHDAHGPAVLSQAGVNLYAMQHVRLVGEDELQGAAEQAQRIHAYVDLPVTYWSFIPAIALFIGGWAAAKTRVPCERWARIVPCVAGGLLYAIALAVLSELFSARVSSAAFPVIEGWQFNPPAMVFRPMMKSALLMTGLFGIVFTYVGALVTLRGGRGYNRGKWWASAKATIVPATVIVVLLAIVYHVFVLTHLSDAPEEGRPASSATKMAPTAAGIGYALMHGVWLRAVASTQLPGGPAEEAASYSFSLYRGVSARKGDDIQDRSLPWALYMILLAPALAAFLAGRYAVRWGSSDGSLPTAIRVTLSHIAVLIIAMNLCNLGWGAETRSSELSSSFSVMVAPVYDNALAVSELLVIVLAFIGAQIACRRRSELDSMFPSP